LNHTLRPRELGPFVERLAYRIASFPAEASRSPSARWTRRSGRPSTGSSRRRLAADRRGPPSHGPLPRAGWADARGGAGVRGAARM